MLLADTTVCNSCKLTYWEIKADSEFQEIKEHCEF